MDIKEFFISSLENLFAMLPQMLIIITAVYYNLKSIRNTTATFPTSVDSTKSILAKSFNEARESMSESFKNTTFEIQSTLDTAVNKLTNDVNNTLTGMQGELNNYRENLESTRNQSNMLVKENKLFMDIIAVLLAKDPKLVKQGISTELVNKLNMTKAEIEQYPQALVTDLTVLKKAIKEVIAVSENEMDIILGELGYERKKL